jgi:hypothetical protein
MPTTIRAKLLLGWMPKDEALKVLDKCVFENHLRYSDKVKLWEKYNQRVMALPKCDPNHSPELPMTALEQREAHAFLQRMSASPSGKFIKRVVKVDPRELAIHQFYVITERSEQKYAKCIKDDLSRINHCLGIGLEFRGQLRSRQSGATTIVELPHAEFVVEQIQNGLNFRERDRYIAVIEAGSRFLLWGGYHRTYAVLSQMSPDGAGGAPLLTLMAGTPDVAGFFSLRSERPTVRDAVLGERPPLFRDFFDADLSIEVQLLKQRVEVHVQQEASGRFRTAFYWANET